jgi:hypothetical protein
MKRGGDRKIELAERLDQLEKALYIVREEL